MVKKFIAGIMACVCCMGLIACGSDEETDTSGATTQTQGENVMLSFDNYDELLSVLMLGAPFGGTEFCTDKAYVVEGASSLRVTPEGEYGTVNTYPTMTIYTDGESFNKGDFSALDNISMYVYNANEVELHIQMTLNANDNQNNAVYAPVKTYTLAPNSWNRIVYDFTSGSLKKSMNGLKLVNDIKISFMEYKQTKEDTPYVYYFDCLQGQKSGGETVEYKSNLGEGQIYNFEKLEDKYLVLEKSSNKEAAFLPITSICNDKVFVTEGTQSLKVEYPCVRNDRVRSHGTIYSYLYFDMNTVAIPETAQTVSLDVINANEFTVTLSLTGTNKQGASKTTAEYVVQPNTAQTFSIPVDDLAYVSLNYLNRIEPIYTVLYVDNVKFN